MIFLFAGRKEKYFPGEHVLVWSLINAIQHDRICEEGSTANEQSRDEARPNGHSGGQSPSRPNDGIATLQPSTKPCAPRN